MDNQTQDFFARYRTALVSAAALVVALGIYFVAPNPDLNAKGILLPTNIASRQLVMPDQVQVLTAQTSTPSAAQVLNTVRLMGQNLGTISLERHFSTSYGLAMRQSNVKQIVMLARQLAAARGANVVVFDYLQPYPAGAAPAPLMIWQAQAKAYYLAPSSLQLEPGIVLPNQGK